MHWLTMSLYALALNMDSFSAGMAYGIRRIRLPLIAVLIISLISVGAIFVSMQLGQVLFSFLSPERATQIGGALLIALGIWNFSQNRRHQKEPEDGSSDSEAVRASRISSEIQATALEPPTLFLRLKVGSMIIQIMRQPQYADLDASGHISFSEALILGVALSMDAFSTGIAVSMLGFSIPLTALAVGAGQLILVYLGMAVGKKFESLQRQSKLIYLPGIILMALGVSKIL